MFLRKTDQMELPIELICANPEQPRRIFEDKELVELRDSIREFGVIQPVIVKKHSDGTYLLIAGERRLRAATMAGLKRIPAVIKNVDEKDSALLALVENVQRENLSFLEEAVAYKKLMDDYGLTQCEIARRVGKQQSTISNKIRLLSLPPEIQQVLSQNRLSERHARALLRITDDKLRKQVLDRILNHGLNVKQSEKLIEDVLTKHEEEMRKRDKLRFINYRIYLNTIRKAFATIKDVEQEAKLFQEDKGEYFEVRITIPKNEKKGKMALAD